MADEKLQPWYREFWAWFILTPLIVVVIVSSITVSLAVRHADDRVIDDYYKQGRLINQRYDADLAALELEINATIDFDFTIGEMVIRMTNNQQFYPEVLDLELSHPFEEGQDLHITVQHIARGQYQAELTRPQSNRWYWRLKPIDMSNNAQFIAWQLKGEIDFSEQMGIAIEAGQ